MTLLDAMGRTSPDQRVYGVVIALVVSVDDPEAIGRVRITLPWYDTGYEPWARVAQLYAGPGYGSTWIPEIETEVLVAFAHGDIASPYVLGGLYSQVNTPPQSRTSSADVKTLRTPKGSELSFDETKGTIDLKTPGGASISLDEQAGSITLKAAKKVAIQAGEITLEADGKLTIKGAQVAIN